MDPGRTTVSVRVLALLRSPVTANALRSAAADLDEIRFDIRLGPPEEWTRDAGGDAAPDILLLEYDPADVAEIQNLCRAIRARFPTAALIATAAEAGPETVRLLLHLGAADFLPQPIAGADLRTALEIAMRSAKPAAPAQRPQGKAIAVLKAGGGAGATTIAVQTACVLAARRKARRSEVCLLDLDVQFGSAALYLDLDDRVGLADLLDARERIDVELLRSVMRRHGTGVNVLSAPRDLLPLDAVPLEMIVESLNLARTTFDTVFIDLPGDWTPWTRAALSSADLILLVTQLTVPGIRRARRQLDALNDAGLSEVSVRLVLNRYRSEWGVSAHRRDAERALGRPFDDVITNDFGTVSVAINRGAPLSAIARWARVTRGMHRLAEGLRDTLGREAETGATVSLVGGPAPARLRRA